MPYEIDVWRVAQLLIKQHGDAADGAARRHRNHCESIDLYDGAAFWHHVLDAIAELENPKVPMRPNRGVMTEAG